MPSTAIDAQGATLQVDNATPGTADTAIANIKSFSGFDGEASEIDVTNLSSTAKEYKLGLKDFGTFSVEMNPDYSDSGQNVLRAAGSSLKTFLLTLPNGTTAGFSGYVKNADSISGGVDGVVDGSVSIKITGSVTITP